MSSGYRRPTDADALATNFRVFAAADCANEPLYAALSQAIAGQPDTLALLMEATYAQRRAVLLFGAVHDLLLAGSDHPLGAFYGTVAGHDAMRVTSPRPAPRSPISAARITSRSSRPSALAPCRRTRWVDARGCDWHWPPPEEPPVRSRSSMSGAAPG